MPGLNKVKELLKNEYSQSEIFSSNPTWITREAIQALSHIQGLYFTQVASGEKDRKNAKNLLASRLSAMDTYARYTMLEIPKKSGGHRTVYKYDKADVTYSRYLDILINALLNAAYDRPMAYAPDYLKQTTLPKNRSFPNNEYSGLLHGNCYSYQSYGKGIPFSDMVRRHRGNNTIIHMDIKDFFPSITADDIVECLSALITRVSRVYNVYLARRDIYLFCRTVLDYSCLWKDATMETGNKFYIGERTNIKKPKPGTPLYANKFGVTISSQKNFSVLAQGSVLAPTLSNIVGWYHIDSEMPTIISKFKDKSSRTKEQLVYTRYSDDIQISGKDIPGETVDAIIKDVTDHLQSRGFAVAENKCYISRDKTKISNSIMGLLISEDGYTKIPRKKMNEIQHLAFKAGFTQKSRIRRRLTEKYQGYLAFLKSIARRNHEIVKEESKAIRGENYYNSDRIKMSVYIDKITASFEKGTSIRLTNHLKEDI